MRLSATKRIAIARSLWGWEPHPTQREWLVDEHPVKVAACGRRWGKTEAAAVDVATYAIASAERGGTVQIIVAPTYDQSKLIFGTVERLLLKRPEIRKHVQVIKTPYPDIRYLGSRIMARTADEDGRNLRGHSADRVIVDEAAFVRDEVIDEVIGPMLADRNGQLVMISTPFGKNHFYRAFISGQNLVASSQRTRSFRFPSWANPHISREYIDLQREVLTDRQFRVEYEAEFVDDTHSVFPWEDIQAATDFGFRNADCGLTEPKGMCIAGIDWARYSDYTAVVVVEIDPFGGISSPGSPPRRVAPSPPRNGEQPTPPYRVIHLDRFNRMDWRAQVERVCGILSSHGVIAVAADQTSVGDPVIEMLRNALWAERQMNISVDGVVFTNQSKREMVDNLSIRLAHRELSIPRDEVLIQELQHYEYELTESGNVRTNARRGGHDDCVMALALALQIAPRYGFFGGFATSGRTRISARGW